MLAAHRTIAVAVIAVCALAGALRRLGVLARSRRRCAHHAPACARADASRRPGRARIAAPLRSQARCRPPPLPLRLARAGRSARPWFYAPTEGPKRLLWFSRHASARGGSGRAGVHDGDMRRFFSDHPTAPRARDHRADLARRRRVLARVDARRPSAASSGSRSTLPSRSSSFSSGESGAATSRVVRAWPACLLRRDRSGGGRRRDADRPLAVRPGRCDLRRRPDRVRLRRLARLARRAPLRLTTATPRRSLLAGLDRTGSRRSCPCRDVPGWGRSPDQLRPARPRRCLPRSCFLTW